MKILKFGGTSVGNPERIQHVAALINTPEPKIVVLSAMSGTTNSLVEISDYYYKSNSDGASRVIQNLEQAYLQVVEALYTNAAAKQKAIAVIQEQFAFIRSFSGKQFSLSDEKAILACGEILSTHLLQFYNEEQGVESVLLNALSFMRVDSDGEPITEQIEERLQHILAQYPSVKLFITQGFICLNPNEETDNLKRGGSDYSATLIGAAIGAKAVEIWTDIDGIHNNDPRIVENTHPIAQLSFDEAAELAYFGAKILHPSTVLPAKVKNIPVYLKNTQNPDSKGTIISNNSIDKGIKAVAAKDGLTAIKIKSGRMLLAYGFLRKVFEIFEKYKTPIDMITTSEVAVSLTIDKIDYLAQIIDELKGLGSVVVDKEQTIVCIVGNLIHEEKGYVADVLDALREFPVRMVSYGGSKHNISILLESKYKNDALRALNKHLF